MARILLFGIASCLVLASANGQRSDVRQITQEQADSRTVLGVANEYLAAGAEAIRAGNTTKAFGSRSSGSSAQRHRAIVPRLCRTFAPRTRRRSSPMSRSVIAPSR